MRHKSVNQSCICHISAFVFGIFFIDDGDDIGVVDDVQVLFNICGDGDGVDDTSQH